MLCPLLRSVDDLVLKSSESEDRNELCHPKLWQTAVKTGKTGN